MSSILCFQRSTCLTNIEFGAVIIFKFVYTRGCVFFMFGVVCGFVCEVSGGCCLWYMLCCILVFFNF